MSPLRALFGMLFALGGAIAIPALAEEGGPFRLAETGERFADLQEAVNAIGEGTGTILIAPGTYEQCAVQEAGGVTFEAEQPGTVVFDGGVCEDKATLVLRGREAKVEGLTFTGTFVDDGNGAGIRLEQGNLSVSRSKFHDAQCAILTANDPESRISIDRSTFAGLGKHPDGDGAHSVYVGDYGALQVTNSRFERGTGGHYLKSRAARVEVLNNSFDDSGGTDTNYHIDLSNGAVGKIAGNVFVQGRNKENYGTIVAIAAEGSTHASAGLAIEGNRVWLVPEFPFVTAFVGSWTAEPLIIRDNDLAEGVRPFVRR